MRQICAALILAASLEAGPIVLITYSATITRSGYINGGGETLDPSPYPAIPAVGDVMTGTFSYDLAVTADNNPNPRFSQIVGSPLSASASAAPLNAAITAFAGTPANSLMTFYDDFQPSSVVFDGIYARASQVSGGQYFGNQPTIILHWVTTTLSSLNSDQMQVLPSGLAFDLVRNVEYWEPMPNAAGNLFISANLDSYTVSVSNDTPEPATLVPVAAALGVIAVRFRRRASRSRILDANETIAP
jgi:hypothetical protein